MTPVPGGDPSGNPSQWWERRNTFLSQPAEPSPFVKPQVLVEDQVVLELTGPTESLLNMAHPAALTLARFTGDKEVSDLSTDSKGESTVMVRLTLTRHIVSRFKLLRMMLSEATGTPPLLELAQEELRFRPWLLLDLIAAISQDEDLAQSFADYVYEDNMKLIHLLMAARHYGDSVAEKSLCEIIGKAISTLHDCVVWGYQHEVLLAGMDLLPRDLLIKVIHSAEAPNAFLELNPPALSRYLLSRSRSVIDLADVPLSTANVSALMHAAALMPDLSTLRLNCTFVDTIVNSESAKAFYTILAHGLHRVAGICTISTLELTVHPRKDQNALLCVAGLMSILHATLHDVVLSAPHPFQEQNVKDVLDQARAMPKIRTVSFNGISHTVRHGSFEKPQRHSSLYTAP